MLLMIVAHIYSHWKNMRLPNLAIFCWGVNPTVTWCEQTAFLFFKHISLCEYDKKSWEERQSVAELFCVHVCVLNVKESASVLK